MAHIKVADLAAAFDTDARTTRKFLRATTPTDQHPGKGGRWEIEANKATINKMTKAFKEWDDARRAARAEVDEVEEVDTDA